MNWDHHFRTVSRVQKFKKAPADFGVSFLGIGTEKTIADLRKLILAKDDEFKQIADHMHDVVKKGGTVDPDWMKDWTDLNKRYHTIRDKAQRELEKGTGGILGAPVDKFFEGFTTAKTYYDGILKSIQASYPDLHISKGDLQDLFNRMPFAIKALPQPGNPPSSQLYQGLDATATYAPDPVKAALSYIAPPLVPKTADEPTYKKAEDKMASLADFLSKNLLLVGVVVGGVALISVSGSIPKWNKT
jgi:hypothetical protein